MKLSFRCHENQSTYRDRMYDANVLKQAVGTVKSGVLSLQQASKQFGIPKPMLSDGISCKISMDCKSGRPQTVPSEIEN